RRHKFFRRSIADGRRRAPVSGAKAQLYPPRISGGADATGVVFPALGYGCLTVSSTELIEGLPVPTALHGVATFGKWVVQGRDCRAPDEFRNTATAAEVPENARLFARESLETKEKPHKLWEA